ncbi:hypothetical protein Ancab_040522 [Ancistrocladus abbreviatus]
MASQSHQSLLFLCLLVYTLTFVFCFLPPTCEADVDGERVDVTLYYETLCPYCSYFIAHDLIRLFTDQLLPIVNLKLVPWGNAALDPSGNFQCQHGQGECLLNTVEACAINVFPDVLELQYAYETAALNPPHTFVPWLLVNNQPLKEDYQNFVRYVCMAYKGPAPPKVCNKSRLETDRSREKAEAAQNVCYSEEPKNLTSLHSIKSWEEGLQ